MINICNIHSLSDFQRNSKYYIATLHETHQPMVLTVNGAASVVIQDAATYQELLNELEIARAAKIIKKSITEVEHALDIDAVSALNDLKDRYEIPD